MTRKPFITALYGLSVAAFLSGSAVAQQTPGTATTTTTSGPGTSTTTTISAPPSAPQPAPGSSTTSTTSTTTSTTKVPVTTKKAPAPKPAAKPAKTATKVEETTTTSTTTTVAPPPQPVVVVKEEKPRTVYDQETLEKMEDKLCVTGFKAHVGSESKNVCNSMANPPDLAYTCSWDEEGPPAFPATKQGPCTLDFTEHRGEVVITRDKWKDSPPMKYGSKAQCCFRASK